MLTLIWSTSALVSLRAIHDHIAEANSTAAVEMVDRLIYVSSLLQTSPKMGEVVSPTRYDVVVSGTPYILVYECNEERVRIVAVLHAKRSGRRNRGPRK